MIRSLMASTALLALITTGALAQQQPADQTQQQPQAQEPAQQPQAGDQQQAQQPAGGAEVKQAQEPGEVLVDDVMGKTVYSGQTEDAEDIGDIADLVLDEQGQISAVVIGVGGFLGIGEKDVAIDFDALEFTQDENGELRIVAATTKEELENAPEFEETDQTRLYGGLSEEDRTSARLPEREQAAQDQQAAEQQAAEQPEQPGEQQAAEQPGQQPQDQQAQQPEQQMAAGGAGEVQFLQASEPDISRASDWIGKQIVTPEDEEIGEVQDLLVDDQGMTEAVIVDVSGMLETEKQVAVPFDSIQVEQQGEEDVRLVANLSREELEQAPAYQGEQATAAAPGQEQQPQDQAAQQPDQQPQDQEAAQQQQDRAAQQPEQQDRQAAQQEGQQVEGTEPQLGAGEILADDLIGKTVYSSQQEDAEEIGEISDLVVDEQGEINAAVIGVGGFLGIGEKDVAVEFDQLQFTQDQNGEVRIVADMTREELEQAQAFEDTEQTQVYGELSEEQRSTARIPEQQQGQQAAQQQEPTATGAAQERQAARAPGLEPQAEGLSAERLMGATVMGANNEEIGEVGDVLFSQDGQIRAVIVDVGGFLGIGAKEVAIEFESAEVQQQDGEIALFVNATEQQLEEAPEWQQTAELQQQQGQQQPGQNPQDQQPAAQPPAAEQPADQQQPAQQ